MRASRTRYYIFLETLPERELAMSRRTRYVAVRAQRKYGFFNFLVDLLLTVITGGLWLIWIFVREMRNR